jgi:3-deoxy-D-manno-octulosonic-acid transferase
MYCLYKILSYLSWPFLVAIVFMRQKSGKDIPNRKKERFGISSKQRPTGKLIWIHAASNGEALSALPLVYLLQELPSAPTILFTTMTVTSAKLLEDRLPKDGCIHQFIPLDHPLWIKRFQDYWEPDMVIWVESELWPNHLLNLSKRNIPAILVNGRLSKTSAKRWGYAKSFFQNLLNVFSTILVQSPQDDLNFKDLGIKQSHYAGNLKDIALPLPFDPIALDDLNLCIGNRPILLFASTHLGEEEIAMNVHGTLKKEHPSLLSIIIPRHPNRAEEIKNTARDKKLNITQRSLMMSPRTDTDIYIADTIGEMGLFYTLCPIVFVGNSLFTKPGGGHNLLEPALLNCAILTGPDLFNF